mmetsp:Transcript_20021/g.50800  ORF Transcript_20021/g.50800 Transcript_20021/m.50800 type:complete len:257 (+) Transcript_20021:821-1591(+)
MPARWCGSLMESKSTMSPTSMSSLVCSMADLLPATRKMPTVFHSSGWSWKYWMRRLGKCGTVRSGYLPFWRFIWSSSDTPNTRVGRSGATHSSHLRVEIVLSMRPRRGGISLPFLVGAAAFCGTARSLLFTMNSSRSWPDTSSLSLPRVCSGYISLRSPTLSKLLMTRRTRPMKSSLAKRSLSHTSTSSTSFLVGSKSPKKKHSFHTGQRVALQTRVRNFLLRQFTVQYGSDRPLLSFAARSFPESMTTQSSIFPS